MPLLGAFAKKSGNEAAANAAPVPGAASPPVDDFGGHDEFGGPFDDDFGSHGFDDDSDFGFGMNYGGEEDSVAPSEAEGEVVNNNNNDNDASTNPTTGGVLAGILGRKTNNNEANTPLIKNGNSTSPKGLMLLATKSAEKSSTNENQQATLQNGNDEIAVTSNEDEEDSVSSSENKSMEVTTTKEDGVTTVEQPTLKITETCTAEEDPSPEKPKATSPSTSVLGDTEAPAPKQQDIPSHGAQRMHEKQAQIHPPSGLKTAPVPRQKQHPDAPTLLDTQKTGHSDGQALMLPNKTTNGQDAGSNNNKSVVLPRDTNTLARKPSPVPNSRSPMLPRDIQGANKASSNGRPFPSNSSPTTATTGRILPGASATLIQQRQQQQKDSPIFKRPSTGAAPAFRIMGNYAKPSSTAQPNTNNGNSQQTRRIPQQSYTPKQRFSLGLAGPAAMSNVANNNGTQQNDHEGTLLSGVSPFPSSMQKPSNDNDASMEDNESDKFSGTMAPNAAAVSTARTNHNPKTPVAQIKQTFPTITAGIAFLPSVTPGPSTVQKASNKPSTEESPPAAINIATNETMTTTTTDGATSNDNANDGSFVMDDATNANHQGHSTHSPSSVLETFERDYVDCHRNIRDVVDKQEGNAKKLLRMKVDFSLGYTKALGHKAALVSFSDSMNTGMTFKSQEIEEAQAFYDFLVNKM